MDGAMMLEAVALLMNTVQIIALAYIAVLASRRS